MYIKVFFEMMKCYIYVSYFIVYILVEVLWVIFDGGWVVIFFKVLLVFINSNIKWIYKMSKRSTFVM